jgi:hypothetical protein
MRAGKVVTEPRMITVPDLEETLRFWSDPGWEFQYHRRAESFARRELDRGPAAAIG